ncbi:GNAT family N-acetyltransferase [Caballeronia sordidicola]|uniref:GNAT family N-acetyltransferase n=1 Tax=Caballeronia sordidicola TaxID=196367 RepID=UPI001C52F8E1|nr:GNAT family N-acetyltransferase [Caballeronia sordidicola]
MKVEVEIAPRKSQEVLIEMVVDYLQELGADTEYPYLPLYWEEAERHPYFILVDGKVAGFALARTLANAPLFEMAEFCVSKSYRGQSIGREAVRALFEMHAGDWRVTTMLDNPEGLKFWRSVVPIGTPVVLSDGPDEDPCMLMLFNTGPR